MDGALRIGAGDVRVRDPPPAPLTEAEPGLQPTRHRRIRSQPPAQTPAAVARAGVSVLLTVVPDLSWRVSIGGLFGLTPFSDLPERENHDD